MDSATPTFGKMGEDAACNYLNGKGYKILERNIRQKFGEIDILTKRPDSTICFIEVKTMHNGNLMPEDNFTRAKLMKMKKICEFFANANPELVSKKGWQLDLVCLTKMEKDFAIKHYENVV